MSCVYTKCHAWELYYNLHTPIAVKMQELPPPYMHSAAPADGKEVAAYPPQSHGHPPQDYSQSAGYSPPSTDDTAKPVPAQQTSAPVRE